MKGIVKHIDLKKKYGFIEYDNGQSIFFHFSQCGDYLSKGDPVQFDIRYSEREEGQAEAVDIILLDEKKREEYIGRVAWYNFKKGYGVIKILQEEVFFHKSALRRQDKLTEDDLVRFSIFNKQNRKQARNIKLVLPKIEEIYVLEDKIQSKEEIKRLLTNYTTEGAVNLVRQQYSIPAIKFIFSTLLVKIRAAVSQSLAVEHGYVLFTTLYEKELEKAFYQELLAWLQEHSPIEDQFSFFLKHLYIKTFPSENLLTYLSQQVKHLDENDIEALLTEGSSSVKKVVLQSLITQLAPIEDKAAYYTIKTYIEKAKYDRPPFFDPEEEDLLLELDYEIFVTEEEKRDREELDKFYDFAQQHANSFFKCQFFLDGLCDWVEPEIVVQQLDRLAVEDFIGRGNEDMNKKIGKLLIQQWAPIQDQQTFEQVTGMLNTVKTKHYSYLRLENYAYQCATTDYRYQLFKADYCYQFPEGYVLQNLSSLPPKEVDQLLRVSNNQDFKLRVVRTLFEQDQQEEHDLERITFHLQRANSYLEQDAYNSFEVFAIHTYTPEDRYRLWLHSTIKSLDPVFVRTQCPHFSMDEVKKILDKGDDESKKAIINWQLEDLQHKPFTMEGLELIESQLAFLNRKQAIRELLDGILPGLDQLYHFHLWLNDYLDYEEKIERIYCERKDEIGYYSISKAVSKNITNLNDRIVQDQIKALYSLDQDEDYGKKAVSLGNMLWEYKTSQLKVLFQQILARLTTSQIYSFGNAIIEPLSKKYTYSGSFRGSTFLHIYNHAPGHIEAINEQYRKKSIFYYRFTYLNSTLFEKRIEQLMLFLQHVTTIQDEIPKYFHEGIPEKSEQIEFLHTVKKFEDRLQSLKSDLTTDYQSQLEELLSIFVLSYNDPETQITLFHKGLIDDLDLALILRYYPIFEPSQQDAIRERVLYYILPGSYSLGEQETLSRRLKELFQAYEKLIQSIEPTILPNQPLSDGEKVICQLRSYLPIKQDDTFKIVRRLLEQVAHFHQLVDYFSNAKVQMADQFAFLKLDLQGLSQLLYENSNTPYQIRFWLLGWIDKFDYHHYCYYYFLLNKAERKQFNKKAKAAMGAEIKASMLKRRKPWQLVKETEDGTCVYSATWRSIWFMNGKIRICMNSDPEFSTPFPWHFSEEQINFLYDYISGKRLQPLTIKAKETVILEIQGLEELEVVIYKAELEKAVKTGQKRERGEGSNRIPINMLLRNTCIRYLNLLQLEGLQPVSILEKAFNPEKVSLSVDQSFLFQIPLQSGEIALIWESLEMEKSKATHIFKCTANEREFIQEQIEDYLSRKSKVRSALNSKEPQNIEDQHRLRYHGRVDHDNFNFTIWQNRLHSLLPELKIQELPAETDLK